MKNSFRKILILSLVLISIFSACKFAFAAPDSQKTLTEINSLTKSSLIQTLANEYDVPIGEVQNLYDNGMNLGEVQRYLREKYPEPKFEFDVYDVEKLATKLDISMLTALEIYNRAFNFQKQPEFIAELFEMTGNWQRIDAAFKRYFEANSKILKIKISNEGKITASEVSSILASVYNVNSYFLYQVLAKSYQNVPTYEITILRNLLFFSDINAEEELKFDLTGIEELKFDPSMLFSDDADQDSIEFMAYTSAINETWTKKDFTKAKNASLTPKSVLPGESPAILINQKVEYGSPFKVVYGNETEHIDPTSGILTLSATDFTLPGKYGMDFTFTRVFNDSNNLLEVPEYELHESGSYYFCPGGSYTVSYYPWTEKSGNFTYLYESETIFVYDDQTSGSGIVNGICYAFLSITTIEYVNDDVIDHGTETYFVDYWYDSGYAAYGYECVDYDVTVTTTNNPAGRNPFNLGRGWTLDFPIYEPSTKMVAFGGSGSYKVDASGKLEHMGDKYKLSNDSSYSYLGVTSKYALESVDGTVYYFESSGLLIAIKDKYGSYIRFIYNNKLISKIIDTVGRKIEFTHNGNQTIVSVYETEYSFVPLTTWTYLKTSVGYGESTLQKVIPPVGEDTTYVYMINGAQFTSEYGNVSCATLNLSYIINPGKSETHFVYESYAYHFEDNSSIGLDLFRVKKRYDLVPSVDINKTPKTSFENGSVFTYSNDYTTRKSLDSLNVVSADMAEETWWFDKDKRITKHEVKGFFTGDDRQKTEVQTTVYSFSGSSRNPSQVTTTVTLNNSSPVTSTIKYEWDKYGNVTKATDDMGRFTEYVYDSHYNMLIQENKNVPISSQVFEGTRTEYELDGTYKNVVSTKEYYFREEHLGPNTYNAPTGNVASTYTWTPAGKINSLTFVIYWKTAWAKATCTIEYRKVGTTQWIKCWEKEFPGGIIGKSGTETVNISLPNDNYDIRITKGSGNNSIEVKSGSKATGYEVSFQQLGSFVYKKFVYDLNNHGNLITSSIYPMGMTLGTPDSITNYSYNGSAANAYITEVSTNVKDANNIPSTITQTYQYDGLGRITKEITAEGINLSSEYSYQYDGLGRVTKITNPPHDNTNVTSYKTIVYNDLLRYTEITDELGNVTREIFDGKGRTVYTEWKDSNNVWRLASFVEYDKFGRQSATYDGNLNKTMFEYDTFGRSIKATFADNSNVQTWYADVNLPIYESPAMLSTPPFGFTMETLARWVKSQDAEGNPSYMGYDIYGRLVWVASNPKISPALGVPTWEMTWYEYDKFNRVTKVYVNRTSSDWDVTEYEYVYNNIPTLFNIPLTMKLPGNVEPKYVYEYNSRGLKTKEYQINNPSVATTYVYDELGRLNKVSYPIKIEWSEDKTSIPFMSNSYLLGTPFWYNVDISNYPHPYLLQIYFYDFSFTTILDDGEVSGGYGSINMRFIDAFGNPESEISFEVQPDVFWDLLRNNPENTLGPGYSIGFFLEEDIPHFEISNDFLKIVVEIPYLEMQKNQGSYSVTFRVFLGQLDVFVYENSNSSSVSSNNVTRTDVFYYNMYGLTGGDTIVNGLPESRFEVAYNPRGQVIQESWSLYNNGVLEDTYAFSYAYNAAGEKISMTYPDATILKYEYDNLHRIQKIKETQNNIDSYFFGSAMQPGFVYDNAGNLTNIYAANGINTQYQYNNKNMVTSIMSSSLSVTALAMNYTYTLNGNISSITDSTSGTAVLYGYTYDAKGQLITAMANRSSYWPGIETVSYVYDGAGNRIQESWYTSGNWLIDQRSYQYSAGNYLTSMNQIGSPTSGTSTYFTNTYVWDQYGQLSAKTKYDDQNNLTQTSYIFNAKGQLNAVVENGVVVEVYTYDALGRRLKVINSDEVVINFPLGNDSCYEVVKDRATNKQVSKTRYISFNGKYLAKVVQENNGPEQKYFHHIDLVGSIRSISNISGTIIASYEYEPFGIMLVAAGTDGDNLGFGGKRLDGSGLSYFGARYYDAEIGRFISRDQHWNTGNRIYGDNPYNSVPNFNAINQSRSLYVYCLNNPLRYNDPNGNVVTPANVIGAVIGAGGGAALGILVADYYGLSGWKRNATIAGFTVGGAVIGWFTGPLVEQLATIIATKMGIIGSEVLSKTKADSSLAAEASKAAVDSLFKTVDFLIANVEKLQRSATVLNNLVTRAYINSSIVVQEIMQSGLPAKDAFLQNGLKWIVEGAYKGSAGIWELVIDVDTMTIVHFLFTSKK